MEQVNKLEFLQALALADKLLCIAEKQKNEAFREMRHKIGYSEEYIRAVWLMEQIKFFKAGVELRIPLEWMHYRGMIE